MLHEFLTAHRALLIDRWKSMAVKRSGARRHKPDLDRSVPLFLDQIIKSLALERTGDPELGAAASRHGHELYKEGFSVEHVIRDFGDVCQAVTGLAEEIDAPILAGEFRTFNRCLDDAISAAVSEYSAQENAAAMQTAVTQTQVALADSAAALSAAQLEAQEARERALHDSLTGLPNRELFDDRLSQAISLADRHRWTLAVMFLDLNRFKRVNDSYGHGVGDEVLKSVAKRLQQYVRDEDTVCRTGGDEFLYLLMNPRGRQNVERIAQSVLWGIAQPVIAQGVQFVVAPSIGISIYPGDGISGARLIANADTAMYEAKRRAQGLVYFADLGAAV